MTIDERIEALTQSVELLASFHRDNEQRIAANEERMAKLIDAMTSLAHVVQDHERRIDGLEQH